MRSIRNSSKMSLLLLVGSFLICNSAFAVVAGHVDDFEDNTTQGWGEGGASPNAPTNEPDGGPEGTGDNYLENVSSGGGGAGSKQLIINSGANWTGDFVSADINNIRLDVRVEPGLAGPLELRIAFQGTGGAWFVSTQAADVPNDGNWYTVDLPFSASKMTPLPGAGTFAAAAAGVSEMRLIHRPALTGTLNDRKGVGFNGTVGYDNISAQSASFFFGWLWETGVFGFPPIYVEEEYCFGLLALAITSDDNFEVAGSDICWGRNTMNSDPARTFVGFDGAVFTSGEDFIEASSQPLVSAGGNLLEAFLLDELDVEERAATIVAAPSDSNLLMLGGYESYPLEGFGFVDMMAKASPDDIASRSASDLEGRWRSSFFLRTLSRIDANTEFVSTGIRTVDMQANGMCSFTESLVFQEPAYDTNDESLFIAQVNVDGDLTNRAVTADLNDSTGTDCTYEIDNEGLLSVSFTRTDSGGAAPVNLKFIVSDDDNYLVWAPDPDGVEEYQNSLHVGYRAPNALNANAIDGNYLFYFNATEFQSTGTAHSGGQTGTQEFDFFGRGMMTFDSGQAGTVPAGQSGNWFACDLDMVQNEIEYQADGQPSLGEVTVGLGVSAEYTPFTGCDYSVAADGALLLNVEVTDPGEVPIEVLFSGYVNHNGEVLTLVDFESDPEPSAGIEDSGGVRHIVAMRYTGDPAADEDGDSYTNLEEFQLPLPPPQPSAEFGDITTFEDVTGDGSPDIASFIEATDGKPSINVYSASDGTVVSTIEFFNDKWAGVALGTVRDANQDGTADDPAVAMLAVNKSTGKIRVETRRLDNGAKINSIQFLNEKWRAVDVVVVDDFNGDGNTNDTAILVLAERFSDGRIQVQARDFIAPPNEDDLISNTIYLNANWSPVAAAVADRSAVSPAGTLAPRVGVLAENPSNGRRTMQSRVVVPGPDEFTDKENIKFLGSAWDYHDISVNHDANSDGVNDDPIWQVLATRASDQVIRVQSKFVSDGSFESNDVILSNAWQALRFDTAPDISGPDMNGKTSQEMVISAIKRSDGVKRIHIKDYLSGDTTKNISP